MWDLPQWKESLEGEVPEACRIHSPFQTRSWKLTIKRIDVSPAACGIGRFDFLLERKFGARGSGDDVWRVGAKQSFKTWNLQTAVPPAQSASLSPEVPSNAIQRFLRDFAGSKGGEWRAGRCFVSGGTTADLVGVRILNRLFAFSPRAIAQNLVDRLRRRTMSINPPSPQSGSSSNWTEPPWSGWIETTGDALLILEAARRGLIPRVTRRLVDSERKMITSGSVFVFDEDESGIKRWTDGFFWSPSRILGNFLLYRETDKRGAGHRGARSEAQAAETANALLVNEQTLTNADGTRADGQTLSRPKGEMGSIGIDRHRERSLVGSLTNSYKFKPDGMMKKTFSLTIGGVSQHLISYYKIEDVEQGRLRTPSSLPELASLDISPEYLDKTHFRNPPKVETGIDGIPRYRGESDESDPSPRAATAPLSTGLPLLLDSRINTDSSSAKRGKRVDPYGNNAPSAKRSKKNKASAPSSSPESPNQQVGQGQMTPVSPQAQMIPYGTPDQNIPPPPAHYATYGVPVANYYHQMPPPGYPMHPPPHPHHVYAAGPPPPPPQTTGSPYTVSNGNGNGNAGHTNGEASGNATPTATPTSPAPPTPSPGPGQAYAVYTGDPNQPQAGQTFTYYPPPPGHYPTYGGLTWTYPAYAPQQGVVTQHVVDDKNAVGGGGDEASPTAGGGVADTSSEEA
ncbi:hypothetical protein BD410DRAFT_827756 [Rickenella mellea]|uniref:Gti1/Pac2 family-domain-containing protein n=1 Tax=Rickenella mellea TaxID=50990 RepID=A0A4Y7Q8B6_9AGAM|nr:hypothetical protein BD410DRAFT_827756 [Rickenella mellea]